MLIGYCCGNLEILNRAELSEILEIIEYLINKTNDETLLRAYQASYAALQNLSYEDFKKKVAEKALLQSNANPQTTKQVFEKVEHYTEDYEWQEV